MARARFDEHGNAPLSDSQTGLRCIAKSCPNNWSVDMGNGRLCHWHNASSPHLWPLITNEQRESETDRAARGPRNPPQPMTHGQEVDAVDKLRIAADRFSGSPPHPHAWAHKLQAKRDRGERLSPSQRHCLGEFERRHRGNLGQDEGGHLPGPDESGHLPPVDAR